MTDGPRDSDPYYRRDLALVHHRGFGFHADLCAPGIIKLLQPVVEADGSVLELGCGSGLLTRKLLDKSFKVTATDASPAMLEIAQDYAAGAERFARLTLPDDPIPAADAIVSIGHAISYLDTEEQIDRALVAIAEAIRPGGYVALDICDHSWGRARADLQNMGRAGDDWAIISRFSAPPGRFIREMTTFVREPDGSWRRDDERHDNVLIDTSRIPDLVRPLGLDVEVRDSFGNEELPLGLKVVIGRKRD